MQTPCAPLLDQMAASRIRHMKQSNLQHIFTRTEILSKLDRLRPNLTFDTLQKIGVRTRGWHGRLLILNCLDLIARKMFELSEEFMLTLNDNLVGFSFVTNRSVLDCDWVELTDSNDFRTALLKQLQRKHGLINGYDISMEELNSCVFSANQWFSTYSQDPNYSIHIKLSGLSPGLSRKQTQILEQHNRRRGGELV
jgi:hypothetical protein